MNPLAIAAQLLLLSMAALAGCGHQAPRHPALVEAALPALLPVRDFVANSDYNGAYQLSPDGRKIAWIAVSGAAPAIFVRTVGQDDARPLGLFSFDFRWAGDSRRLLLRRDRQGDENFHVWSVDSEAAEPPADLTPFDRVRAGILAAVPDSDAVLIADNRRDARFSDLYRIGLESRASVRVAENPGDVADWIADRQGVLRGRIRYREEKRWLELHEADAWRAVYSWGIGDTVQVLDIDAGQGGIWLRSNRGRDRVALVRLEAGSGSETLFHEDPAVDIGEAAVSSRGGQPLFAQAYPDYPRLQVFDADLRDGLQALHRKLAGENPLGLEILGTDRREETFVIGAYDHAGKRYYLWDRRSRRESLLGSDALHRHAAALAPIRPVALASRDGLTLHGYLTLPTGASSRPLPMVLLVHGGPWARNLWADPDFREDATRVQFLANRGYAVLQVNYRGSTGYGRRFHEAAIGEFAGRMQDDLLDAVAWAVREGIADPERVAVMGASYGGYAALVGLSQTPRTFACGVDLFGPSDLVALIEQFPPYWQHEMPLWHKFVGNPALPGERRRLAEKSPIARAAAIERPLLIMQGTGDVRVAPEQSERMVAALRQAGKAVDYLKIEGMGHGGGHWPSKLRIYRKTEDFLAACLGGRSSGFDILELVSWAF